GGYVIFHLRLQKPRNVEYTIRSFLDEKKHIEPDIFEKKLRLLHGVDSNFSYRMDGDIEYPDEFKLNRCELMVNPLAGSDYNEASPQQAAGYHKEGHCL